MDHIESVLPVGRDLPWSTDVRIQAPRWMNIPWAASQSQQGQVSRLRSKRLRQAIQTDWCGRSRVSNPRPNPSEWTRFLPQAAEDHTSAARGMAQEAVCSSRSAALVVVVTSWAAWMRSDNQVVCCQSIMLSLIEVVGVCFSTERDLSGCCSESFRRQC